MCCGRKPRSNLKMTRSGLKKKNRELPIPEVIEEEDKSKLKSHPIPPYDVQESQDKEA